jgi:hypothetical protein
MTILRFACREAQHHQSRLRGGRIVTVASLAIVAAGCSIVSPSGFGPQPGSEPVSNPVLVSADGKTIYGYAPIVCGRRAKLVARSNPRKVSLVWLNPASGCDAEIIAAAIAHTTLRAPLGARALVQASDGTAIPYFSERELAQVTVLPRGYRLRSDLPTDNSMLATPEPGDTRIYAAAGGTLSITQIAPFTAIFPLARWPWPGRVLVAGQPAALIIARVHGVVDDRSITWAAHGYRFIVTISAPGSSPVRLSTTQLAAIAAGLILKPGQYQ